MGAWGQWEKVEGEGRGNREAEKKYSSIKQFLKKKWQVFVDSCGHSRSDRVDICLALLKA